MLQREERNIQSAMIGWVEDMTSFGMRNVTTYPPQPAGSRYVRTDVLRGSWHVTPIVVSGNEVSARIVSNGNAAPYNRLVQDADYQARVHRGRWTNTAQETTRRMEAQSERFMAARLATVGEG